ncbi:MAG: hypothetical protein HRO68_05930 [Nitrosopumilus sp.]|nr:hypothetical protein [Nitrosopumilus sp.]
MDALQDNQVSLISILQSYELDNDEWLEIHDTKLIDFIRKSYFDTDKNKLLTVCNAPMTKDDQIKKAKVPQSSGYKKHKKLVDDGFLIPVRRKPQYSLKIMYNRYFSKIDFFMEDTKTIIRVKINDNSHHRKFQRKNDLT